MRFIALAVLLCACNSVSREQYATLVEEARACSEPDSCVLAGSSDCVCPMPVHASEAERIQSAAEDVDSNGAMAECIEHSNVRCEAGRCISDESP